VEIAVDGPLEELAVRIPEWCAEPMVDGEPRRAEDGYIRIQRPGTVVLELPMPVRAVAAHPRVDAVRDCVAFARGPIVYCIEQADHEGVAVEDLRVDPADPPQPAGPDEALGVPVTLAGRAHTAAAEQPLYGDWSPSEAPAQEHPLRAIPYFRWANRGPNAMRVWIPVRSTSK
jgi:DUF1680 family protein